MTEAQTLCEYDRFTLAIMLYDDAKQLNVNDATALDKPAGTEHSARQCGVVWRTTSFLPLLLGARLVDQQA